MEVFDVYNSRNLPNTGRFTGEDHALALVVMSPQNIVTIPLLGYGEVVIGRSLDTDVPLSDPGVSPRHARLAILPGSLAVEDLGSEGGTFLRDLRLATGERAGFMLGEPIRFGSTVVIVRRRSVGAELRRMWSPGEFAALVEDECLRAHRRPSEFAVAHIALDLAVDPGPHRLSDLIGQVDHALPPPHMLGAARSGGLQVLLVAVPPMLIRACLRRLMGRLRERGYGARLGLAWFPGDARTPLSLRTLAQRRAQSDLADAWLGSLP
jgi:FHA domain